MQKSNPPKKHHYIPAFYLRQWQDSNNKLFEFSKPRAGIEKKTVSAEATGFEQRLYELRGFEPELAQQMEDRFFKPLDTAGSQALAILECKFDTPLTKKTASDWTRFVMSLLLRCPEDIKLFKHKWHTQFYPASPEDEQEYLSIRGEGDPPSLAEFMDNFSVARREEHAYKIFMRLVDNKEIGNRFINLHWHVLELENSPFPLMTSDRPVIRTNGIDVKWGHLALPIGPRRLFLAYRDEDFMDELRKKSHKWIASECNRHIVEGAQRFVYSQDDRQHRFIENRFGKNPQPRLMSDIVEAIYKDRK